MSSTTTVLSPSTSTSLVKTTTPKEYRQPEAKTYREAGKLAIAEDKVIKMDYWVSSLDKTAIIGVYEDIDATTNKTVSEKILVQNNEEYTSPIENIYKSETELIIKTANSIYIVDAGIKAKKIQNMDMAKEIDN